MVDWIKYKPNIRDGAYFVFGAVTDRVLLPLIGGQIKNAIRNSYEELYARDRAESQELYKKIDALSNQVAELGKKVGTSA